MSEKSEQKKSKNKSKKKKRRYTYDRHALYESAVQSVDFDVEFIEGVFEEIHGRKARRLREDFCGTAAFAAEWVRHHPENEAWGVDLDAATLQWGRKHRVAPLGEAADRLQLRCGNVLSTVGPPVEVQTAFNFSYCIFKERAELLAYFETAYRLLEPGGLFLCDLFGGNDTLTDLEEKSRRPGKKDPDGRLVPPLTYYWEQESFDAIDNHFVAHISFEYRRNGKKRRDERAFSYDWRLWSLPEVRDLLDEAGFEFTRVYSQDWDDENDEADDEYVLVDELDNDGSWVVYLVAKKPE